mmetsp:Transcript_139239/g.445052  ORF Transcript_139239/g.445052 Transcript_139239/m.445052 type:complete len:850 (-) Transcript_139239:76-2625(-)
MRRPWLALFWAVLWANEACATMMRMKLHSKQEIMANMTLQRAMHVVFGSKPELTALLQEHLAQGLQSGARGKVARLRAQQKQSADPTASSLLNRMLEDTQAKLDNEVEKCGTYHESSQVEMDEIRQDIASYNSGAAEARGNVLKAQTEISMMQDKMPEVDATLKSHKAQCSVQAASMKQELDLVTSDLGVMVKVLDKTTCKAGSAASAAALVQCSHCGNDGGLVMLQHSELQPLLSQLQSSVAHGYVQHHLMKTYHEAVARDPPVMLTQDGVTRQIALVKKGHHLRARRRQRQRRHHRHQSPEEMFAEAKVERIPEANMPVDCVPNAKCTLGAANCERLRDRFLLVHAGIEDRMSELSSNLGTLETSCLAAKQNYVMQLQNLGERLREENVRLAEATTEQVEAEASGHLKAQQHQSVDKAYQSTMKECCDNQNDLRAESCALEKIRGELEKLNGLSAYITDCEVSEWQDGECSAPCRGGTQTKSRSILVHPVEGMACPPLTMQEGCNTHECPVDCRLDDWEGWTACSAECGGGVRERSRSVLASPSHGGDPCDEKTEAEACNPESCDKDCELHDWTEWGACSKACWQGSQRRERGPAEPAQGTGTCPEETSDARMQFQVCNVGSCSKYYHRTLDQQNLLKCGSKVDLVVLLDGSGSLGTDGWAQSKKLVTNLISSLQGGEEEVKVALQLFSGPSTTENYKKCTGGGGDTPKLKEDCGIQWVQHFTSDTSAVAKEVEGLAWPAASTLTSMALAEADAELTYGREDASSIVVVITDGQPMSHTRTLQAAELLKRKARIIWVPVGSDAPMDLIRELASLPKKENMIHIKSFSQLSQPLWANKIISHACPKLV